MPTEPNNPQRTIVVVGGGVSGLAAAHHLVEQRDANQLDIAIRLVEAADRLGGSIETTHRDGFLVEGGPDSFITQKPWALALAKRLGLTDRLVPTNPDLRRTFVAHKGRLLPVPEGFMMLAPTRWWPMLASPLFSLGGKLRMGMDLVLPRGPACPDESLASFVKRRLGREALERMAQPMIGGIYTADPERLSLRATMPRFLEMEEKHRSIIKGMRAAARAARNASSKADAGARYSMFVSLDDGMKVLVDAITDRLGDGLAETGREVRTLTRPENEGPWRVVLADGESIAADAVILTTPAPQSARILADLDPELAAALATIEYASSATVSLAYRRAAVSNPLDGFGFVVPAVDHRPIIAASYSSVKFPGRAPADHVLLRAFVGGALNPEQYERSDDEVIATVENEMAALLGIRGRPLFAVLRRYPSSMPQYPVGHLDDVARMFESADRHRGLKLAGNAYGGVGIPDCVHSGEQAAAAVLNQLNLV